MLPISSLITFVGRSFIVCGKKYVTCWTLGGTKSAEKWTFFLGSSDGGIVSLSTVTFYQVWLKVTVKTTVQKSSLQVSSVDTELHRLLTQSGRFCSWGDQREQSCVCVAPAGFDSLYSPRQRCRRRTDRWRWNKKIESKKKKNSWEGAAAQGVEFSSQFQKSLLKWAAE